MYKRQNSVRILRALVLIIVRKVVSVNIVPAQTIIAKGVSSVLILRVPVLTAVKGVNSVLTLRVLVPAVIIKAVTVLIVLVPAVIIKAATVLIVLVPVVIIKVVDTIVPIVPVRLIITRMQSIV